MLWSTDQPLNGLALFLCEIFKKAETIKTVSTNIVVILLYNIHSSE